MSELHRIALFPLNVVLFPHTTLPLHIFEHRYREMITECMETNKPFGVVLAEKDKVYDTGCSARVTDILKKYQTGEFDIMTIGEERFTVEKYITQKEYLQGLVRYFDDTPVSHIEADRAKRKELCGYIIQFLDDMVKDQKFIKEITEIVQIDTEKASFPLAKKLGFDAIFQQKLLELRSETLRLARIGQYLSQLAADIKKPSTVQIRFGPNGHGKKK
jgi:Lon protease-like protein